MQLSKMLIRLVIITCSFLILGMSGQEMLGEGRWSVLEVQPCANHAEMPWTLRVRTHELNRTHDAYDVDFNTSDDFDDSVGIRVNTCIMMGDECKHLYTFQYDCARIILYIAARNNVRRGLEAIGMDPPEFPVPQGEYHVENFVLDLRSLNNRSVYGDFSSEIVFVKNERDVLCSQVAVRFQPLDESISD